MAKRTCLKRYKEPTHSPNVCLFSPFLHMFFVYNRSVFIYVKIILFHLRMLSNIIIVFGRRLQHVSDPNLLFLLY